MKKLNLLNIAFILLFFAKGFAQDWNVIKPNSIAYYKGSDSIVAAIRIDSTSNYSDSIDYFNFNYIRSISIELCDSFTIKGASWLGEKVRYRNNGISTFYNYQNKPITINTKAQLGESWQLFTYPNDYYIEATVAQADSVSFLSLKDSVKTISLQLKNYAGINITSSNPNDSAYVINHSILRLSKNYGLINSINFYYFPFSIIYIADLDCDYRSKSLYLIGLSNPIVGYQNLTARDIFNFEVGDQIHYSVKNSEIDGFYVINRQQIDIINGKTFSINNEMVEYSIKSSYLSTEIINGQVVNTFVQNVLHNEEIVFSSLTMQRLDGFSYEPYQYNNWEHYFWAYIKAYVTCKVVFDELCHFYYDEMFDECGFSYWFSDRYIYKYDIYYPGLGGPYWYSEDWSFSDNGYSEKKLVYYKKGNIEWGTPYNFLSRQNEELKTANNINIYPNPTSNTINIELPQYNNQKYKISFCNLQGKILLQKLLNNSESIDISDFSEGVYFLKIETNNFVETKKIIVVK